MPKRPPRVCSSCGSTIKGSSACPCAKARKAKADRGRPSARQRGYDSEFQRAAAAFLKLHPTCSCGKPAVLVRHRESIARRPDLRMDRSNWMPGCRSCNAKDAHRDRRNPGVVDDFVLRGVDRPGVEISAMHIGHSEKSNG